MKTNNAVAVMGLVLHWAKDWLYLDIRKEDFMGMVSGEWNDVYLKVIAWK